MYRAIHLADVPHTDLNIAQRNMLTRPKAQTHLVPPQTFIIPQTFTRRHATQTNIPPPPATATI